LKKDRKSFEFEIFQWEEEEEKKGGKKRPEQVLEGAASC
jgi:hypothetical protein